MSPCHHPSEGTGRDGICSECEGDARVCRLEERLAEAVALLKEIRETHFLACSILPRVNAILAAAPGVPRGEPEVSLEER